MKNQLVNELRSEKDKIISIVYNDMSNDSRVIKVNRFLSRQGFKITIIAIESDKSADYEEFRVKRVSKIKLGNRLISFKKIVSLVFYFKFLLESIFYLIKYKRSIYTIYCNDILTLPAGIIVKLFTWNKVKVIYDCHEYESEINGSRTVKFLNKSLEKIFIGFADLVITVSDSIANEYVRLYGIEKPALVLNCPPFANVKKKDYFRKKFHIKKNQRIYLYQGGVTTGRGIEQTIEAFKHMSEERVLVVMGYGPLSKMVEKASLLHRNIFYHTAVSPDVLLDYTSSADYGLCLIEDVCLSYYYCLPNKLFEYIMAGIPVIVSDLFELKKIVEGNGIGVVSKSVSSESIIEAVLKTDKLNQVEVKTKLKILSQKYSWERQESVLLNTYESMYFNDQVKL